MKKLKTFKEKFAETSFAKGEFYIKLSFTIFFVVIYVILFIFFDGVTFFESQNYSSSFQGNPFQIHVIDVENGDAIFIKLPNNKTMLIDTGEEIYYDRLSSYIRQYNHFEKSNSIDYLLLTHEDSDHIGSAKKIIENFNVKRIYRPKLYSMFEKENILNEFDYKVSSSNDYNNVIKAAFQNNCELMFSQSGTIINEGDCQIEFLLPMETLFNNSNNDSAVIMLSYQSKKFLFTGDIEYQAEEKLIEKYGDKLKADVLKVAHHGSATSSSQRFLNYVQPDKAILSSSGKSSILPNIDVVNRLKENNIEVFATGNIGHFAFTVESGQIKFAKAVSKDNFLALIFAIFVIFLLLLWHFNLNRSNIASFKIKNQ